MNMGHGEKKYHYIKKYWLQMLILILYLGWNIFLLIEHELWRDEANVWLIARELSPIEIIKEARLQGHPCLWYLLVMPFAKLGLPCITISVLSLIIMTTAVILLLWKAPFHNIVKIICVFSPMFTYYYSVIARNYCLIALLLVILAVIYQKRNEHYILYGILLGILVQVDTIAVIMAGMISAMWLWEGIYEWTKKKNKIKICSILKGIWIPIISLPLLLLQFFNTEKSDFVLTQYGKKELIRESVNKCYSIIERMVSIQGTTLKVFVLVTLIILLLLCIYVKNIWPVIVVGATIFYQSIFSLLVYGLHIWHYISIAFVLLWCLWVILLKIQEKTNRWQQLFRVVSELPLVVFCILFLVTWCQPTESSNIYNAVNGIYSDGKGTAQFIEEKIPVDAIFVSTGLSNGATVLAYASDREFYYAQDQQIHYFCSEWEEIPQISLESIINWEREQFGGKTGFYIVLTEVSCLADSDSLSSYKCVYHSTDGGAQNETYEIYFIPSEEDE